MPMGKYSIHPPLVVTGVISLSDDIRYELEKCIMGGS